MIYQIHETQGRYRRVNHTMKEQGMCYTVEVNTFLALLMADATGRLAVGARPGDIGA